MSMRVELGELAARIDEHGFAYLVSVDVDGKAHVLAVTPEVTDTGITCGGIGRHTLANVAGNPAVTMVWPPVADGGFSLIVDGTAIGAGETVTVSPVKAILHRPAPGEDGKRVGNDCAPVSLGDP